MENYEVVTKLIGPISPVGETNEDYHRFANLKAMTELVDKLIYDIKLVADGKKRIEYSIQKAGNHANDFLINNGIF